MIAAEPGEVARRSRRRWPAPSRWRTGGAPALARRRGLLRRPARRGRRPPQRPARRLRRRGPGAARMLENIAVVEAHNARAQGTDRSIRRRAATGRRSAGRRRCGHPTTSRGRRARAACSAAVVGFQPVQRGAEVEQVAAEQIEHIPRRLAGIDPLQLGDPPVGVGVAQHARAHRHRGPGRARTGARSPAAGTGSRCGRDGRCARRAGRGSCRRAGRSRSMTAQSSRSPSAAPSASARPRRNAPAQTLNRRSSRRSSSSRRS